MRNNKLSREGYVFQLGSFGVTSQVSERDSYISLFSDARELPGANRSTLQVS